MFGLYAVHTHFSCTVDVTAVTIELRVKLSDARRCSQETVRSNTMHLQHSTATTVGLSYNNTVYMTTVPYGM